MFGIVCCADMNNVNPILADIAVKGRLQGLIDIHDTPTLLMQDGRKLAIPGLNKTSGEEVDEIFIVNCTKLLFDRKPKRPMLSANDITISPHTYLFLPGLTASFMTHLWLAGKLQSVEHLFYHLHYPSSPEEKEIFYFRARLASTKQPFVLA